MSDKPFLQPRMTGARFEDHAIPLELLKDLAVLEEMVIEVAKWNFLKSHPTRHRCPRGFTHGVSLKLAGIEDGSAIPLINLSIASDTSDTLFPSESQTYLERARDSIIRAIEAAGQNGAITDHLPTKALGYFDRMGRSLRDGEAIEFATGSQEIPARLTKETRRRLILASSTRELTEDISIRGAVPEADQDNLSFEVQLPDGHKVRAPMAAQHMETVLEAFTKYREGVRVLLQGIGKFSRQGRLQSFESIEHISVLDHLDVPTRLDELRVLSEGWLDGKGVAPNPQGLDWLANAFEENYPADLLLPYIYPTAEGHIQAEWSLMGNEITLEINISEHSGEWHLLDIESDAEETQSLNLERGEDWKWLAAKIREIAGSSE